MDTFAKKRNQYKPILPLILQDITKVSLQKKQGKKNEKMKELFPHTWEQSGFVFTQKKGSQKPLRVGVFFSGGQAAGGHNVIAGLWDAILQIHPSSTLIGFLDGPSGLISGKHKILQKKEVDEVRNLGGFHLLGSGRTKVDTEEQRAQCLTTCQNLALDGLVVIGGDDSNTNAAILAEYFLAHRCKTHVIGVPKTIDGDLRTEEIEMSFGFDSACKTYAEMIGNICLDALSAKKYYHIIKLMGRSASHITLECAFATRPNLALIGEEKKSLSQIVQSITNLIVARSQMGKEYGVILIPEGLIEFIPELGACIAELSQLLTKSKGAQDLSPSHRELFFHLPQKIQEQLLLDRDPHGNIALSQVETETLLIDLVKKELQKRPEYKGKFSPLSHFFGYEGRACFPTNFDANYCYSLGVMAAIGIRDGATGVICAMQKMDKPVETWVPSFVSLVNLIHLEERHGKKKPVIAKALVDVKSQLFARFLKESSVWALEDCYQAPGPIQFFGEKSFTDTVPYILG